MSTDQAFAPFANDTQVVTLTDGIHELSIENGTESVLLAGEIELTADQEGLQHVRALREALAAVEAAIVGRLQR